MRFIKKLQDRLVRKNLRNQGSRILKDTKRLYSTKNGIYKPERKKLHQTIIHQLQKNAVKGANHPHAFFFGGGSGSGKTTLKINMLKEHPLLKSINAVHVDPDEIKQYLPEFEQYKKVDPENAALLVHKESCDIRDRLVDDLIRNQKNFIYESTMAKPQKYKKLFTRLHHEGYKVHLYITDIPVSLAIQRIASRAKQDGRIVPIKAIESTHKLIPKTFLNVRDLTNSYHIYNSQEGMELVTSCTVRNSTHYHEFIKKGS